MGRGAEPSRAARFDAHQCTSPDKARREEGGEARRGEGLGEGLQGL